MKPELFWLTLTVSLTALLWIPYTVNRIFELGVWDTLANPNTTQPPKTQWAGRMIQAHRNAVENLIVFAPLMMMLSLTGGNTATLTHASMLYFFARLAHVVTYTLGIPFFRTVAFLAGFVAQMTLAVALLKSA